MYKNLWMKIILELDLKNNIRHHFNNDLKLKKLVSYFNIK